MKYPKYSLSMNFTNKTLDLLIFSIMHCFSFHSFMISYRLYHYYGTLRMEIYSTQIIKILWNCKELRLRFLKALLTILQFNSDVSLNCVPLGRGGGSASKSSQILNSMMLWTVLIYVTMSRMCFMYLIPAGNLKTISSLSLLAISRTSSLTPMHASWTKHNVHFTGE